MLDANDLNSQTSHYRTTNRKTLNLTHKTMTLQDYKNIAKIIKHNEYFENIIFPTINPKESEQIFLTLDDATIHNTTLTSINFQKLNIREYSASIIKKCYQNILSRMERNKNKIFSIHGGGNIGLGLMADIVAKSPINYKILATSGDGFRNNFINYQNQLWLEHPSDSYRLTCINNITMLDANDTNNLVYLYLHASLLAICLPESGVISSAQWIAKGLTARYHLDQAALKIIILMNKNNCDLFVKKVIEKELLRQLDRELVNQILANIKFIPTVVDRISSKVSKKSILRKMKMQFSKNTNLETEMHSTPRSTVLNIPLFTVEQNYNLFVPNTFKEARHFPGVKPVKNIEVFTDIKNKFINGPHAVLAWLAALMNYNKLSDAINNPILYRFINYLMEYEIKPILLNRHPDIGAAQLNTLKTSFLQRCKENNVDLVKRVGRDPLRKLNKEACVRGLLTLKKNHRLKTPTPCIEFGIAAGILYAISNQDPLNNDCKKMCELYNMSFNFKDILLYNGSCSGGYFKGFDEQADMDIIKNILSYIGYLQKIMVFQPWKRLELVNVFATKQVKQFHTKSDEINQYISYNKEYQQYVGG